MANEQENKTEFTIYESGDLGQVKISGEVIAIIAGIAAMDTEGVRQMAGSSGSLQKELISRLGMKVLSKGVQVNVHDGCVSADISVVLDCGCSIPQVTEALQEKVKSAIETMTGMKVEKVNVHVVDVNLDEE